MSYVVKNIKTTIRKYLFETPSGILFFYRIRIIREKFAMFRYSDFSYVKNTYKKRFGREINLKNPETYTEKLQWLKLFYRNIDMPVCSDKYEVRKYLADNGYAALLNEMIGVYTNANEIDFDKLPTKFVAKATHGSSWNLICKNKQQLNEKVWKKIMNSWLKLNLYVFGREWNYKNLQPRIIIEKFLENEPLNDYKFMCFNGVPRAMQINNDRNGKHYVDFYDINWNKFDFTYRNYTKSQHIVDKPKNFEKMVAFASELSKPFPFVRVDFYDLGDRIVFGELTFFPGGGLLPLEPEENGYDSLLGSWLNLPEPNNNLQYLNKLKNNT